MRSKAKVKVLAVHHRGHLGWTGKRRAPKQAKPNPLPEPKAKNRRVTYMSVQESDKRAGALDTPPLGS